jgi:hypothetical protein
VHGWGRWTSDEGCCIKDATSGLSGDAKAGFSGDATMDRPLHPAVVVDGNLGRMKLSNPLRGCLFFHFFFWFLR